MGDIAAGRVALHFAGQAGDRLPVNIQSDHGVQAGVGVQYGVQLAAVDGDRFGLGITPIHGGRDKTCAAQSARLGAAAAGADGGF